MKKLDKSGSPICKFQISDTKTKEIHKFKYLESISTKNEDSNIEIRRRTVIKIDSLQKLNKKKNISLATKIT